MLLIGRKSVFNAKFKYITIQIALGNSVAQLHLNKLTAVFISSILTIMLLLGSYAMVVLPALKERSRLEIEQYDDGIRMINIMVDTVNIRRKLIKSLKSSDEKILDFSNNKPLLKYVNNEEYMTNISHLHRSNMLWVLDGIPHGLPVKGRVISGFGWRSHPKLRDWLFHRGIDIPHDKGTKIHSTSGGMVTYAGWGYGKYSDYGYLVVVDTGFFKALYAHMSRIHVRRGQKVYRNTLLGRVGNTGMSTGSHLHYGIILKGNYIDPGQFY